MKRAAAGIGLYVNAHKTEYMCYNQTGDISTLDRTYIYIYIYICIYDGESKSNAFFFSTGIITDTGTCVIHQN